MAVSVVSLASVSGYGPAALETAYRDGISVDSTAVTVLGTGEGETQASAVSRH